jgi:uracil-DNA glycosylase
LKADLLQSLNKELKEYIDDLYQQTTPLIFGDGDVDAQIVLIGEAPGKNEILQGRPFVGQAGKNLDEFINVLEIKKTDLYITNVVKMRPYKINEQTGREANRTPTKKEVSVFTPHLMRELEIVKPKLVVTLGNIALKCITQDENATIGMMHGNPSDVKFGGAEFSLFPLYHPASIIYKADLKDTYNKDLLKLKDYIRNLM